MIESSCDWCVHPLDAGGWQRASKDDEQVQQRKRYAQAGVQFYNLLSLTALLHACACAVLYLRTGHPLERDRVRGHANNRLEGCISRYAPPTPLRRKRDR
jgi:hypothetical protein